MMGHLSVAGWQRAREHGQLSWLTYRAGLPLYRKRTVEMTLFSEQLTHCTGEYVAKYGGDGTCAVQCHWFKLMMG